MQTCAFMHTAISTPQQHSFELKTWGGKRRGAGRKSTRERSGVPHTGREEVRAYHPVHVSLRVAEHVWNLRSERSYRIIDAALRATRRRPDFRVVHFSIQGNHIHLIVEANGTRAFSLGVRALSIRLARRLNVMMGRSGPVFSDRYHAHVLRTPAEVRNAVRYVLGNFESHAARRGERTSGRWVDPFSSAAVKAPREAQTSLFVEPATSAAGTWLLRQVAGAGRCAWPPSTSAGRHGAGFDSRRLRSPTTRNDSTPARAGGNAPSRLQMLRRGSGASLRSQRVT